MTFRRLTVAALAVLMMLPACVKVNGELGENLIATNQQYDIHTIDIPLTETELLMADSLAGFSSTRITLGAIRDDVFGETERATAFTLIPALDTLDFGEETTIDGVKYPQVKRFHIAFAADTISTPTGDKDRYILQNVDVFSLTEPLKNAGRGTNDIVKFDESTRISDGTPVYMGKDSLSFDFTKEFARKYIDGIRKVARDGKILITREGAQPGDTVSMEDYTAELPGVYLRIKPGSEDGGRINMFKLSCMTLVSDGNQTYYTRNGNVATLRMKGVYNGEVKDTAFLFIPGEVGFVDEIDAIMKSTKFAQYAFNYTGHSTKDREGVATGDLLVEGGGGLKPVIQASEMRDKVRRAILKNGGDPDKTVINLATVYLPFEEPANYLDLDLYPTALSPTLMIKDEEDGSISFKGLADAAASVEDQGTINRSLLQYQPDITWHLQNVIRLKEEDMDKIHNYDIWFFALHDEIVESANNSSYDQNYLQQMLYYNYLNSMYGGYGYGGYGGYGYGYGGYGYGYDSYGYSNYYNMMLLNAMYSSSGNTSTTTATLDKDRYYKGILNGPDADRAPVLRVTYGIPRQ